MLLRLLVILSLLSSAVGLAAIGFQMMAPSPAPRMAAPPPLPPPLNARILAANRPLLAGTLLKDEDFRIREVSIAQVPQGALSVSDEGRAELRGSLLRRYVETGEAVGPADILRPRDRGFLAAVLRPSMRAISVGVDVVTGAAGLIWPGDRVDLILTQELPAGDVPLSRRVAGETLLTDLRVIAIDQQFTQGATAADATPSRIARTVTLEVTPEQAEWVAVGSRLGRLALTVRSIDQVETGEAATRVVFGADISPALARSAVSEGVRMRVIQGDGSQEVIFR